MRSLLLVLFYVLVGLPASLLVLPYCALRHDMSAAFAVGHWIVRRGLELAGVRVVEVGRENIPAVACLFMSNHVSNLDPLVLIPRLSPRTVPFLKSSLMRIPVLGTGMRMAGYIPTDRTGSVEGARRSMAKAQEVLASGVSVLTFVEGTRSKDGRLLPFKSGPFFMAGKSRVPCIPITLWGTRQLMPKGSLALRKGTVHVTYHEPVTAASYSDKDAMREAVRSSIQAGLPRILQG